MQLDSCKVIPSVPDHISQRGNCIVLIARILTEEIACLSFCTDVVAGHIPHCHSKEMMMKSEKLIYQRFYSTLSANDKYSVCRPQCN
ncbi:unnamed protein product [Porites evermanni]|uniref:Uncharacterized protein n=1 Tax=Porites evermanni TaxID=104178 RepID=A0ABN8MPF5_9CNID|nr:unnamed protein product [Porites evermanni]